MLLEVETDKAVVEIEAAGDGILGGVTAKPGDVIQVGHTIAWLLQPGESPPAATAAAPASGRTMSSPASHRQRGAGSSRAPPPVVHASHPRHANSRRSMASMSRA